MLSVPSESGENPGNVCDLLSNSPKHLPRFSPGYQDTEEMSFLMFM